MADIQSMAAEIRRGKKEDRRKKKETTGQKYNGPLLHRAAITSSFSLPLCGLRNSEISQYGEFPAGWEPLSLTYAYWPTGQ